MTVTIPKILFKHQKEDMRKKLGTALVVPNVVDFIKEHSNSIKKSKYFLNCSILDIYKIINEYNLTPETDTPYGHLDLAYVTDEYYKSKYKTNIATLAVSQYGQYGLLVKINKAVFLLKDTGRNLNKVLDYSYNSNNVYLDIETTGLNYLTDDIISLALYQPSTGKTWSIYLPLEKQQDIPETAAAVNHITKELLVDKVALTQDQVNYLIEYFDLEHNNIIVWTGKRLFDAIFLQLYFYAHNLVGFDTLKFINAKTGFKNQCSDIGNYSKDYVAMLYNIDLAESHTALGDCKITSQICEHLHNKTQLRDITKERNEVNKLFNTVIDNYELLTEDETRDYYNLLVSKCRNLPNGRVFKDYDLDTGKQPYGYHRHHLDEDTLDNIGARTSEALKANDTKTLAELKPYNKADRLVYLTIEQHFIIHCLIEKFRPGIGGGPHYLFAQLLNNDRLIILYKKLLSYENLRTRKILKEKIQLFWLAANPTLTKTVINKLIRTLLTD